MENINKKHGPESTFLPIEMFPEGQKAINKTFPVWNFQTDNFYKEINIYVFIVSSLTKGINDQILNRYIDYFGKDTILDAFEYYKDRVSKEFRDLIKNRILDIVK